jgi:hypothetical protein
MFLARFISQFLLVVLLVNIDGWWFSAPLSQCGADDKFGVRT